MGVPPGKRIADSRQQAGSRPSSPRFHPYPDAASKSQILFRLHSPVRHNAAGVLPGVQTTVPIPSVQVREEHGGLGQPEQPRTLRTDLPLRDQGWSGGIGGASSRSVPTPDRHQIRDVPEGQPASEETATSKKDIPPAPVPRSPRATTGEPPVYENVNPFASLRAGTTGGSQGGATRGARPKVTPRSPQQPSSASPSSSSAHSSSQPQTRSILKKSGSPHTGKQVKYSPSTKGSRPENLKRPPTPDFEVTIRPTSALDIFDEVLAGQPSKRKDGRTIPDTLIQINEPIPPASGKRPKKVVEPSDRTLRSKKH